MVSSWPKLHISSLLSKTIPTKLICERFCYCFISRLSRYSSIAAFLQLFNYPCKEISPLRHYSSRIVPSINTSSPHDKFFKHISILNNGVYLRPYISEYIVYSFSKACSILFLNIVLQFTSIPIQEIF